MSQNNPPGFTHSLPGDIMTTGPGPKGANAGQFPCTFIATPSGASNNAAWLRCIGAGTLVATNDDGTTFTRVCVGNEVIPGSFSGVTSYSGTSLDASNIGLGPNSTPAATAALSPTPVASVATMQALTSATNGQTFLTLDAGQIWRYAAASVLTSDVGPTLVATAIGIGSGAFLRVDRAVTISAAETFATAVSAVLYTVPAGFRLTIASSFHNVTTSWTGGSSSAIGASSSNAGANTAGDLLGGSGGDVAATLVSTGQYAKGTAGAKIGTPSATLVGGDTIIFNRVVSTFTAGAGTAQFIAIVDLAPTA
jgi:hypothetical protein